MTAVPGSPSVTTTSTSPDPVERYALAVLAGEIIAGPLVRAAARRHLDDLRDGPARGLVWRLDRALRAIEFFADVLRLADGEHAAKPFELILWQQFIVGSLFGWYNEDGTRRFRVGYCEVGKGNGKSPMAAGIGLYMLTADGEEGAEVYAAATVKDQAKILYRDAVNMVDLSEDLTELLVKHGEKEVYNIVYPRSRGFFKPISSEKRGLDGKRVHCALLDEVHEHPGPIVVDKMRAGTKGRRNALILEITNSGFDRTSICYQHHEYSERVVTGQVQDDSWFAYVCGLDIVKVMRDGREVDELEDPLTNEACWVKANPNLGVSIQRRYLREQVREAHGMPAKASIVKRLNFCMWVEADNPAIDQDLWRARQGAFVNTGLGEPVGALDLSGVRDLTALALFWPGVPAHAAVEFWTPLEGLVERSQRDRVPYDLWVQQGHVTATPGRAIDYRWVAVRLGELQVETGLRRVAFDPYRIKYLEKELEEEGVELELVPHGQGFYKAADSGLWMPHSIEVCEKMLGDGTIIIRPNPALTYAAASAVHETDPKENRIYTKKRSRGRIDGLVALTMAAGLAEGGAGEAIPADYVPTVA